MIIFFSISNHCIEFISRYVFLVDIKVFVNRILSMFAANMDDIRLTCNLNVKCEFHQPKGDNLYPLQKLRMRLGTR